MGVSECVGLSRFLQTTPTVRLRSRLTFGSDRHFTQVTKGGVNNPPYSTVIHLELFRITKQDDQSRHTTRRAKINATGFGPWRSRGAYISSLHTLSLLHSIIRLNFERTVCVIQ